MPIVGAFIVPHPPLIVPEVGGGEEIKVQKTIDSYHKVAREIGELSPDTIIIYNTPYHSIFRLFSYISR